MLCKYYLHIGQPVVIIGGDGCHDVSDCVVNTQDLEQSFTRADYGGVTRKYGSQIEFKGLAYDLLVGLYREAYLNAEAAFAIYVIDDSWEYQEAWQCPLDFASFSYDENKVSVNCIDNSAAALIKANGGIKSSYEVSRIKSPNPLYYDRVVVPNLLKFGYNGHTQEGTTDMLWSIDDVSDAFFKFSGLPLAVRDITGVVDNKCTWQDQDRFGYASWINSGWDISYISQVSAYGYRTYFLKAGVNDVTVNLDFTNVPLRPTEVKTYSTGANDWLDPNQLPYAVKYYLAVWNDDGTDFRIVAQSSFSGYDAPFVPFGGKVTVLVPAGYNLSFILEDGYWDNDMREGDTFYWRHLWFMQMSNSPINVGWDSRGDPIYMDVIKPDVLLNKLLDTCSDGKMLLIGSIEATRGGVVNNRLAGTMFMAAESARGLKDAMIHTSFNEFCKFMESEFGYVYSIERYVRSVVEFDGFIDPMDVHDKLWTGTPIDVAEEVYFIRTGEWEGHLYSPAGLFVGYNSATDRYFTYWGRGKDWSLYNHRNNERNPYNYSFYEPNNEPLFLNTDDGCAYIHESGVLDLHPYDENSDMAALVRFLHRSDLFKSDVVKELTPSGSPDFSLSGNLLYSAVHIGYDKQEYEKDNTGRDEWNFSNEYRTGVALKDQTLELICPYRADCYGIEELAAIREKPDGNRESTSSDEDVFIVKCLSAPVDDCLILDRTISISGTYSDTVFNALYAPMFMVMANDGYIASFCSHLSLSMTHGSRDVVINYQRVTRDFDFTESQRLFKAGMLKVRTSDQDIPSDLSGLISFEWGGNLYKGFLRAATVKYQREEPVEYELIEHSQSEI